MFDVLIRSTLKDRWTLSECKVGLFLNLFFDYGFFIWGSLRSQRFPQMAADWRPSDNQLGN